MKCHEARSHSFEDQGAAGLEQPPVRGHLLTTASERSDLVARMDEIERLRLQLALEQIIDDEFYVGDAFGLQK